MNEDAQKLVDCECTHLRSRYTLLFNEAQVAVLNKALDYAVKMHDGQYRVSGEPYIVHPIAVANILLRSLCS